MEMLALLHIYMDKPKDLYIIHLLIFVLYQKHGYSFVTIPGYTLIRQDRILPDQNRRG